MKEETTQASLRGVGGDQEPEEHEKGVPFFPDFALLEAITAFALLTVFFVLASTTRAGLEEVANPNASGYTPRPEWYFLWLFQLLKYFKGALEPVGTFLVPTVAIVSLLTIPFWDRRQVAGRRLLPGTRPVRLWPRLVGAGAMVVIGSLTLMGVRAAAPMPQPGPQLTPVQAAGRSVFDRMGCLSCHTLDGSGGTRGPDLTHFGSRPDAQDRVLLHFSGLGPPPGSEMPSYQLSAEELGSLAEYLMSRK